MLCRAGRSLAEDIAQQHSTLSKLPLPGTIICSSMGCCSWMTVGLSQKVKDSTGGQLKQE